MGQFTPTPHDPDARGHFGPWGGRFVPEALIAAVDELAAEYDKARLDPEFVNEFQRLLRDFAGRPSLLTEAPTPPLLAVRVRP